MSEHNHDARSGACPSDIELASFVDGDLTTDVRARIVTHLAGCDDCREVVAMAAAEALEREQRPVPWYRRRTVLVAMAASLAASLAVVLVPRGSAPPSATTAWTDLAAVAGTERTVEARLSAPFTYRPLVSPTRSATASGATANFQLEGVAARLRDEAARVPTADRLHAAGVADLVLGRTSDAVTTLLQAVTREHAAAAIYADLAAAHIAEARQRATPGAATTSWLSAVEAADRACELEATLAAGWFNRALALERLGRTDEARQAWQDYTTRFTADDGWRAEALGRLAAGPP